MSCDFEKKREPIEVTFGIDVNCVHRNLVLSRYPCRSHYVSSGERGWGGSFSFSRPNGCTNRLLCIAPLTAVLIIPLLFVTSHNAPT